MFFIKAYVLLLSMVSYAQKNPITAIPVIGFIKSGAPKQMIISDGKQALISMDMIYCGFL